MLKIKDLSMGSSRVSVEGVVVSKSEPRNVKTKMGEDAQVADCVIEDDSGKIVMSLWNNQIEQVNEGDQVRVENGYVTSFRSELRLNVGRYGKLFVNGNAV
ncbi:MAG: DNA-binding protein [Nitrososphaerota archaeon]|jgi:replication factor A1|nr:OB-fold nucleic acid binding domain-containing protein [Nitrososphaerota archaeon]MDG6928252.1 DNA-binding protein [Nitrososphaerota archaeon]MDG6932935.1 DNA-binding protein [Nitrososphaerota archaeon]MDG6936356.1 DNA-binding protein [Nitrososphaerota archaeon]MDG6943928.1 DNA-binding protein [Nitrososphaerota archaeon]